MPSDVWPRLALLVAVGPRHLPLNCYPCVWVILLPMSPDVQKSEITAIALANLLVKRFEDPVHSSQRFGFVERPLVAEELITLAKRTLV